MCISPTVEAHSYACGDALHPDECLEDYDAMAHVSFPKEVLKDAVSHKSRRTLQPRDWSKEPQKVTPKSIDKEESRLHRRAALKRALQLHSQTYATKYEYDEEILKRNFYKCIEVGMPKEEAFKEMYKMFFADEENWLDPENK